MSTVRLELGESGSLEVGDSGRLRLGQEVFSVSAAARRPLVSFMVSALEAAKCVIRFRSNEDEAPFGLVFDTSDGERIGIVAYAFRATRRVTRNRPHDERSFQVKYGEKDPDPDKNLHPLWQDRHQLWTTLLLGIDPNEEFFVAADAAKNNPIRFHTRFEFKDEHAGRIKARHWFAWERTRRLKSDEPVQTLVGGTKQSFLRYVRFDRDAIGLSATERHRLAEKGKLKA